MLQHTKSSKTIVFFQVFGKSEGKKHIIGSNLGCVFSMLVLIFSCKNLGYSKSNLFVIVIWKPLL